jgi:NADH-quinone oxidoreductase subunit D
MADEVKLPAPPPAPEGENKPMAGKRAEAAPASIAKPAVPARPDGSTEPYRVRVRPPSFVNLQALDRMVRGSLVADVIAVIGTIDTVLGEVDR